MQSLRITMIRMKGEKRSWSSSLIPVRFRINFWRMGAIYIYTSPLEIDPLHLSVKGLLLEAGHTRYCSISGSDPLRQSLSRVLSSNTNHQSVAYRGFLAPGAKMKIGAPYPQRVGLANAEGDLPCYWVGGLGRSTSRQRFLEYLGVNGTHFWIAFNTIFNPTCQTDKCRKRFPLLLGKGGLGRSPSRQRYWEHLGVNGTHFLIALTPFSTLRVRLASSGRRSPSLMGVWGGAPAAIPYRNGTCESHVKFQKHMWFFTCETHVHCWSVSHVKFHTWFFTCVSHVKFNMGFFTCEISHVKFHMWNFTCEISHVKFHMWIVTCDISHVSSFIWLCCAISFVNHLMGKLTCDIPHVNFQKLNFLWWDISCVKFQLWLFYAVIHVAFHI